MQNFISRVKEKKDVIIAFAVAFALMVWLLSFYETMANWGTDVTDIWKTITSFYSGNIQPSYVLYKGFLSVYPYVWLYELSKFLGLGHWFFIKIFHCFLFSYVSAVGFPFIISKLLNVEVKLFRRLLVIVLMFIFWKTNMSLQNIMIDLPALTFFILSVSAALKIAEKKIKTKKVFFVYTGIVMGMASTYTGQYMPAIILLVIYVLINVISRKNLKETSGKVAVSLSIVLLLAGIMIPRTYNSYFENTVVNPMRENGAWIPSSKDWTDIGLGQAKRRYNLLLETTIPNHRSLAIIKQDKGEAYESFIESGGVYSRKEVINLILKHPVDFATSWCNGFLLTASIRGEHRAVLCLFTSYTALFLAMYSIFKRCKKLKEFFSPKFLIVVGFISTSLVTCLMHFEPRYVMAFQGLFLSAAFLDNTLWDGIKGFVLWIRNALKKRPFAEFAAYIKESKFPYAFALYVLFVIMCFTNYAALVENVGADPSILFNWIY